MRALSVDLGTVRTGVAISDCTGTLASPLCVIKETDKDKLLDQIVELIKRYKVDVVVVGFPKNMDGTEGESAKRSLDFKENLESLINIKVFLIDERWSTRSAQGCLNVGVTKARKKKGFIDQVAATIILQQYLDGMDSKQQKI